MFVKSASLMLNPVIQEHVCFHFFVHHVLVCWGGVRSGQVVGVQRQGQGHQLEHQPYHNPLSLVIGQLGSIETSKTVTVNNSNNAKGYCVHRDTCHGLNFRTRPKAKDREAILSTWTLG